MQNGIILFLIWKMFMQNRLYLYWNRERVMQNVSTFYLNRGRVVRNGMTFFLIRKMVMKNDIFGISVGAYCIRPLKTASKETYDQKYRYMWGIFNTPLPWRTKRSIPKINFLIMRNVWSFFWSGKCLCRIDYPSIWIEKGSCKTAQPFFWIEKWSC